MVGDSGYDCNYCNGKNHLAKDCVLRMKKEKEERVKDEAYYVNKIADLKKVKITSNLIAELEDSEDKGNMEVRSSRSDDEEMRKPTHGQKELKSVCLIERFTSSELEANYEISTYG